MSAQEQWKREYRRAKYAIENYSKWEYFDIMAGAAMYRREAALERIIARQERMISALQEALEAMIDDATPVKHETWPQAILRRSKELQG